jgi:AcrR family transcriptional regulator
MRTSKKRDRRRGPAAEARRALRREAFVEAAIRAIRREGPSASMSDVATEAGVTKPILYRHFRDKEDLYQAVAERYVADLIDEVGAVLSRPVAPRELLVATLGAYVSFLDRETEVYRFLWERAIPERPGVGVAIVGFRGRVAEELERILQERLTPAGVDREATAVWTNGLVGMVAAAGEWWMESRPIPKERLVEHLATLLWDGFSGITSAQLEAAARVKEEAR